MSPQHRELLLDLLTRVTITGVRQLSVYQAIYNVGSGAADKLPLDAAREVRALIEAVMAGKLAIPAIHAPAAIDWLGMLDARESPPAEPAEPTEPAEPAGDTEPPNDQ